MKFAKAHGLGNDFILVAESEAGPPSGSGAASRRAEAGPPSGPGAASRRAEAGPPSGPGAASRRAEAGPPSGSGAASRRAEAPRDRAAWARRLCDRHEGVGGDGVIVYAVQEGFSRMALFNADGSDGEVSGNGLRCLAGYVVRQGWLPRAHVVRTVVGPRSVEVEEVGASRFRVGTDLGPAVLASRDIPMLIEPPRDVVIDLPLEVAGRTVRVTVTSLGNPHCAIFTDGPAEDALLSTIGPALERHPAFPRRTNVEFVSVRSREELRVRFWERGVGYTRASGTGAASAAVAAILNGLADRRVRVICDGGILEVEWPEGGHVRQMGEVEVLFEGDWLPEKGW